MVALFKPSPASTLTPSKGTEITVSTIAPGDTEEPMVRAPEIGFEAPCGWNTKDCEVATVTEPPIAVLAYMKLPETVVLAGVRLCGARERLRLDMSSLTRSEE